MSKRKGGTPKRQWQPMYRTERVLNPKAIAAAEHNPELAAIQAEKLQDETWGNILYTATVRRAPEGHVVRISVHRRDRKPLRDWRDLQHIKNDIAGPEVEAFELFPAESRLMDTSNEYWLWCFAPGIVLPVGFMGERNVSGAVAAAEFGAVQREPEEESK